MVRDMIKLYPVCGFICVPQAPGPPSFAACSSFVATGYFYIILRDQTEQTEENYEMADMFGNFTWMGLAVEKMLVHWSDNGRLLNRGDLEVEQG